MAQFYNDTFTEASSTNLSAHTPEVGTSYVYDASQWTGTNTIVGGGTGVAHFPDDSGNSFSCGYVQATPGSADYTATATVAYDFLTNALVELRVRATSDDTFYAMLVYWDGTFYLRKVVGGTNTFLVSSSIEPQVVASFDLSLSVSGTAISATAAGQTINTTDSSITGAGKVGIGGRNVNFAVAQAATDAAGVSITPAAAAITLTGQVPTIASTSNVALLPAAATIALSGPVPSIVRTTTAAFTTDGMPNNTGTSYRVTESCTWTWITNGDFGDLESADLLDGSGATDSGGALTVTVPAGAGVLVVEFADGGRFYQAGTAA